MAEHREGRCRTLRRVAPHQRLRREQTTAEAAVARKPRSTRPPRTRASRVVRPAFATLAQHFNQGSDTRSLVVRPDLPQESLSRGQPRGIVVSGSPRERPQGDYHQVGVEVVREGRREFVYYLLISADEAGIAVRKVVTDADAEQSEANAGVKAAPPSDISPETLTIDNKVGSPAKLVMRASSGEVFRSDPNPWYRGRASPQVRKNHKVVLINDFLAEYATFTTSRPRSQRVHELKRRCGRGRVHR